MFGLAPAELIIVAALWGAMGYGVYRLFKRNGPRKCPHCGADLRQAFDQRFSEGTGMDEPEQDPLMHPPGTAEWEQQNKETSGWSAPTLIFAITILVVFVVAGVWAGVDQAREASRRAWCSCHGGGAVSMALTLYSSDHGTAPPSYVLDSEGRRIHSWRALILPYIDAKLAEEYSFDEPWDGPNNSKLHLRMPNQYRCPSDTDAPEGTTNYVAVVGEETMWPPGNGRIQVEVTDGPSNTIQLVESVGLNINWLEPRDLEFATMDFHINGAAGNSIGSRHPGGAMFWMADGSRRFFDNDVSPDLLRALLTVAGDEKVGIP